MTQLAQVPNDPLVHVSKVTFRFVLRHLRTTFNARFDIKGHLGTSNKDVKLMCLTRLFPAAPFARKTHFLIPEEVYPRTKGERCPIDVLRTLNWQSRKAHL